MYKFICSNNLETTIWNRIIGDFACDKERFPIILGLQVTQVTYVCYTGDDKGNWKCIYE